MDPHFLIPELWRAEFTRLLEVDACSLWKRLSELRDALNGTIRARSEGAAPAVGVEGIRIEEDVFWRYARDFEDRDFLHKLHIVLSEAREQLPTLPQLGAGSRQYCVRKLHDISARAVNASHWLHGAAFVAIRRLRPDWDLDSQLNWALKTKSGIVAVIRAGEKWYDARKEAQSPGGWFTSFLWKAAARAECPRRLQMDSLQRLQEAVGFELKDEQTDRAAAQSEWAEFFTVEMEKLDDLTMHIVQLVVLQDCSFKEIGKRLGISTSDAHRRWQAVLLKFCQRLGP